MKKTIRTAVRFFQLAHKMSKTYFPLLLITAIMKAAAPFPGIIMPKFIIDEVMGEKRVEFLIFYIGIAVLGSGLINLIVKYLDTKVEIANFTMVGRFEQHMGEHIMNMDYENLEDPQILDQKERAIFPINNQGVLWRMSDSIVRLLQSMITILGLAAIVLTFHVFLLLMILAILFVNTVIFRKEQALTFQMNREIIPLNRSFLYYITLIGDFSMAKDVRIYHMAPFIMNKVEDYNRKSFQSFRRFYPKFGRYDAASALNLQLQMVLVYLCLSMQVLKNLISIGDFTMYVGAANNFSGSIFTLLSDFVTFVQNCKYLEEYLEFEKLPSRISKGTRTVKDNETVEIQFRNVYFRYPRSTEYILKNVNLTIRSGEKLSIVGKNGAGKTTFIKLLCRLYIPEKGEILINGININEYSTAQYNNLLSVVFQDYKLFSFSIRENIVFYEKAEEEKLIRSLNKAGIFNKIKNMEHGVETSVYKNFDKNGIELSGGEGQKLAIARAIYKDSPVAILDEPTAALDPYAEFDIYTRFNELVNNKTAIYISHRLSSCRFCNHIAVFDQGEIVEYGTHDELIQKAGLYHLMWNTQAQYYA